MGLLLFDDRYVVGEILSQTSVRTVYLVEDTILHRRLVLKTASRLRTGARTPDSIRAEYDLLASLTHPYIIAAVDFGHCRLHGDYYTMEAFPGAPVSAQVSHLSPASVRNVFIQLIVVLYYLQSRGIQHNRLTLEHILLESPSTLASDDGTRAAVDPEFVPLRLVGFGKATTDTPLAQQHDVNDMLQLASLITDRDWGMTAPNLIPPLFLHLIAPELDLQSHVQLHDAFAHLLQQIPDRLRTVLLAPHFRDLPLPPSLRSIVTKLLPTVDAPLMTRRVHLVIGGEGSGKSRVLRDAKRGLQAAGIRSVLIPAGMHGPDLGTVLPALARPSLATAHGNGPPAPGFAEPIDFTANSLAPAFRGYDNDRLARGLSISRQLRDTSVRKPVALLVDNLERLSSDDLDLLRFLVAASDGPRLIFSASMNGPDSTSLATFVDFISTRADAVTYSLPALTCTDIAALVASVPTGLQDTPGFVDHLCRITSGSPGLLEAVFTDLASMGALLPAFIGWSADPSCLKSAPTPASLIAFATKQLANIPTEHTRLVEHLAVLDSGADPIFLSLLLARDQARVASDLSALARLDILHKRYVDRSPRFTIRNGHVRDAIYARIPLATRRAIHSKIATALLPSVNEEDPESLFTVARHLVDALDLGRAPEFAFRAARAALRERLTHKALEMFTSGLNLTLPDDVERRFEGLAMVGWLHTLLGNASKGRDAYTEMLLLARKCSNRLQEAIAVQGLAEFLTHSGDPKRGIAYSHEAEALAVAAGHLSGRARSMATRTQACLSMGSIVEAEHLASLAFEAASTAEDVQAQSYIRNLQGLVAVGRGAYDSGIHHFEQALELKARNHDFSGMAITLNNLGLAYLESGHLIDADKYLGKALLESREKGLAFPLTFATVNLGEIQKDRGTPRAAIPWLLEALTLSDGTGRRTVTAFAHATLGSVCLELGTFLDAATRLSSAEASATAISNKHNLMLSAIYRSSFALALGHGNEAAEHARRAIGMCEELDASVYKALASDALASCTLTRDEQEGLRLSLKSLLGPARQANRLRETMYLMTALGRIHLAAGDARKALPPVREAIRLAQTGGLTLYELRAALLEGRALLLLGRPEEAGRVLEAASVRMAEGELRPLQAETLYWLAQAQEASGDAAAAAQSTFLSAALVGAMADEITDNVMREDYLSVPLNRAVLQRAERLERSGLKPQLPSGARGLVESDPVAVAAEAHDEAVRSLGADAAPRRVIAFLIDRALRALRADHGLLILLSPDGHEVSISRELDSDAEGQALEPDLQAMARARQGDAVLSNDPCFVCAPLRPGTQGGPDGSGLPLGALYFDSASSLRYFRDHDLRLASAFADRAAAVLTEAQETRQRVEKAVLLNRELARRYDMTRLVGESPAMERLFRMMEAVIGADCNVLLTGESGTGKEMVARAVHYAGARKDRDFVALNCGAVPDSLAESELFGHRKGAFSGADADRRGLFEEADGGTLFLDEIGNATPAFQAKLLRVLQSGELRRLGETITRKVDARIIAATNADIDAAIREGRFREDLYYRLNVVTLTVPPLRERREDIPLLAEHFARALCETRGVEFRGIGQEALARLRAHDWPGNVRELEHTIESAFLLAKGGVIRREHLPGRLSGDDLQSVRELLHEAAPDSPPPAEERAMVERALASARGDKSQAARILGWSRMKLYRRLRSLEIPYDTGRASS